MIYRVVDSASKFDNIYLSDTKHFPDFISIIKISGKFEWEQVDDYFYQLVNENKASTWDVWLEEVEIWK